LNGRLLQAPEKTGAFLLEVLTMKWQKLIRKFYVACIAHDTESQKKLYKKALRKNVKANLQNKPTTVPQVTVNG
jgi:hypothetical protein